jgi:hypothetical protein
MEGAILVHFTPKRETVNSQNCDVLQTTTKPAIRSNRRGKLRKDVILLHENSSARALDCMAIGTGSCVLPPPKNNTQRKGCNNHIS